MDKRYQVFVSSTFADLSAERQIIMKTLMEMGHFPAGMELFSAMDEEQWPFIVRIIDDSDYYVLILGGRYGSLADKQISYTEKEFDYAKSEGKRIIALVHGDPSNLPVSKTDQDSKLAKKLENFREKVCTGRMVKFWNKPEELAGHLALALPKTIKMFPARGWVRADVETNESLLRQLATVQRDNIELNSKITELEASQKETKTLQLDLETLNEAITIELKYEIIIEQMMEREVVAKGSKEVEITYKKIFEDIADYLLQDPSHWKLTQRIAATLIPDDIPIEANQIIHGKVSEGDFRKIIMRFLGCSLVDISSVKGEYTNHKEYHLTDFGKKVMAIY